jgi:biopolymer transport protein ExbD
MAELDTSSGGGKKGPGVKKAKKLSTKIDLTPMVDLGFLLITFFIFTTTMSKPKTMDLSMPKDDPTIEEKDKTKVKASAVLTALLSKNNLVYYYEGIGDDPMKPPAVEVGTFKSGKVRKAIIDLKKRVEGLKANGGLTAKDNPTVIIKPDSNCTYEDVVNMLDEMTINAIDVYAIVDIGKEDRNFISATEALDAANKAK